MKTITSIWKSISAFFSNRSYKSFILLLMLFTASFLYIIFTEQYNKLWVLFFCIFFYFLQYALPRFSKWYDNKVDILSDKFVDAANPNASNHETITQYDVWLDDIKIGTTKLEKADAPMGVVGGKILFSDITYGYDFFKKYCLTNEIEINSDYPDDKLISTANISSLKVIRPNGIEIKGQAINIDGMDSDIFEVTISGVPYPFFEEEFPQHVKAYNDQFKAND